MEWHRPINSAPEKRWGFPKIRGIILGVPIIRTIVFWGLYWGPPILGNYQIIIMDCPCHALKRSKPNDHQPRVLNVSFDFVRGGRPPPGRHGPAFPWATGA